MMIFTNLMLLNFGLLLMSKASGQSNLARGKPVNQSSTFATGYTADKAVDGDNTNTFSHTNLLADQWWYVDLEEIFYVGKVVLYNRGQQFNYRLQKISILTALCDLEPPSLTSLLWINRFYQEQAFGDIGVIPFIPRVPARFLAVYSSFREGVTLKEVEIYENSVAMGSNVALGKPATATAEWVPQYPASAAVDGVSNDGNNKAFATYGNPAVKWWRVDLGDLYVTYSMTVYSRPSSINYFLDRLENFYVLTSVSGDSDPSPFGVAWRICFYWPEQAGPRLEKSCDESTTARYVAIYTNHTEPLDIAEVEVYGRIAEHPGPEVFELRPGNETCLTLSWKSIQPALMLQGLNQYRCGNSLWKNSSSLSADVCELRPGKMVSCSVRALLNVGGCSLETTNMTLMPCAVPSIPQISTSQAAGLYNSIKRVDLSISWTVSTSNCQSFSRVFVSLASDQLPMYGSNFSNMAGSAQIQSLTPFTNYSLNVTAFNNQDLKSWVIVKLTTMETEPYDPPADFKMSGLNVTCVKLSWKPPQNPNGIISRFKYWCDSSNQLLPAADLTSQITSSSFIHRICGFTQMTKVTCNIQAVNSAGTSPAANATGYTHISEARLPKLQLQASEKVDRLPVTVLSKIRIENGTISVSFYRVVIAERWKTLRKRRSEMESIDINFERIFDYNISRLLNLTYYIAAEMNASLLEEGYSFVIGDGRYYNGYWNAPLREGVSYIAFYAIGVKLEDGETFYQYSAASEPFQVIDNNGGDDSSEQVPAVGMIAGVTVGMAVLVGVSAVVVVFLYQRRKLNCKPSEHLDQSSSRLNEIPASHNLYEVINNAYSPEPNPIPGNPNLGNPIPRNPIPGNDRVNPLTKGSITKLKADFLEKEAVVGETAIYSNMDYIPVAQIESFVDSRQLIMEEQFEQLESFQTGLMHVAALPENKGKSRYKGLYPVDLFRVVLDPAAPGRTDYINASHIEGYEKKRNYIAAQGPTENTLSDFLLMVWQQKIAVIVMVTNLWENGKKKCDQYWPQQNEQALQCDVISVKTESEQVWADFVLRTLRLSFKNQSRLVEQFHFLSWPDHDVPKATNPFVMFYEKVHSRIGASTAPVLVHCSAGVGRTGTFIALDYLIAQAKSEEKVEVFGCVKKLRERRPKMIQTKEQYNFVHKVLAEALTIKDFVSMPEHIGRRLASYGSPAHRDLIKEEFQHVEKVIRTSEGKFQAGNQACNRQRNRFQDILPDDTCRVLLADSQHDYINAIALDGYRQKGRFVVTQFPLANTVDDFWSMVDDKSSCTIVQLGKPQVAFYPSADGVMEVASARITHLKTETTSQNNVHNLELTNAYGEKTIKVYEVMMNTNILPLPGQMLEALCEIERWQQESGNNKLVVTCNNGSTLCGVFVCAFNSMERLKTEQEVDVYNQVVISRLCRPQFISTIDQYFYLYEMLGAYIDKFSEYANVQ